MISASRATALIDTFSRMCGPIRQGLFPDQKVLAKPELSRATPSGQERCSFQVVSEKVLICSNIIICLRLINIVVIFVLDCDSGPYDDWKGEYNIACFANLNSSNVAYRDLSPGNYANRQWMWLLCNEPYVLSLIFLFHLSLSSCISKDSNPAKLDVLAGWSTQRPPNHRFPPCQRALLGKAMLAFLPRRLRDPKGKDCRADQRIHWWLVRNKHDPTHVRQRPI